MSVFQHNGTAKTCIGRYIRYAPIKRNYNHAPSRPKSPNIFITKSRWATRYHDGVSHLRRNIGHQRGVIYDLGRRGRVWYLSSLGKVRRLRTFGFNINPNNLQKTFHISNSSGI